MTALLVCAALFAYAKGSFSHDVAHFRLLGMLVCVLTCHKINKNNFVLVGPVSIGFVIKFKRGINEL